MTIGKLQVMEKETSEIIDQEGSIKIHATNLKTFICIKEMQKVVEESKTSLKYLHDRRVFDSTYVELEHDKSRRLSQSMALILVVVH